MNNLKNWREEVEKGCGLKILVEQNHSRHCGEEFWNKRRYCANCQKELTTIKKATQLFEEDLDNLMEKLKEEITKGCMGTSANCYLIKKEADKITKEYKNKLKEARG